MGQPVIINIPPETVAQDPTLDQTSEIASLADSATIGAGISSAASEVATIEAAASTEAATVSTEAAEVSTEAAATSVTALEQIRQEVSTLTERVSLILNSSPTAVSDPAVVEGEPAPPVSADPPEERTPIKRTPDKPPTQSHWYFKDRRRVT